MKNAIQIIFKLILISFLLLTITCKKDELVKVTNLKIGSGSNVTGTTATIGAEFVDLSANVTAFGHCYATTSTPTISDSKTTNSGTAKKGAFSSNLTGLSPNTTYFVRAYAMDNGKAVYSDKEISFTTLEAKYINITAPVAADNWTKGTTQNITWTDNIDENVDIILMLGESIVWNIAEDTPNSGTYSWKIDESLAIDVNFIIIVRSVTDASLKGQSEAFEISETLKITINTPNTGDNWQKGSSQNITWTDNISENVNIELFKGGTRHSDIKLNTASDGTESWTVPTVALDADNNYTIKISSVDDESITDESDHFGISDVAPESPTVVTGLISNIQYTTVSCGGEVTNEGSETVTERGICWSTSQNPTTADSKKSSGDGIGTFSVDITGLTENTTYYVRAYATNSVNTSYGEQKTFKTEDPPVVVTNTFTPDYITASGGGTVTNIGSIGVTTRGVCWGTSQNPTVADNRTIDGSGIGSFSSNLSNLDIDVTYYVRAYATNILGTVYGNDFSFTTLSTVTDYDGHVYNVVKIGNQGWLAENLKTTHYANGTAIPPITDNTAWSNLGDNSTDDACCYYENGITNRDTYGTLYTWAAAMNGQSSSTANPSGIQGVCPNGWHVPSLDEWTELIDYLGGESVAGGKMKATGTIQAGTGLWEDPNTGANNESGFSAVPGGFRSNTNGGFYLIGSYGSWWSATENSGTRAWTYDLENENPVAFQGYSNQSVGNSVRCIRD